MNLKKHKIDWTRVNRIMIANSDDSFMKHEHIKLELVRQILNKYKRKKNYQEVYTEYVFNGKIADVVHINKFNKEIIAYEIQKNITDQWLDKTSNYYINIGIDWILIDLRECPDNLEELKEFIREKVI